MKITIILYLTYLYMSYPTSVSHPPPRTLINTFQTFDVFQNLLLFLFGFNRRHDVILYGINSNILTVFFFFVEIFINSDKAQYAAIIKNNNVL